MLLTRILLFIRLYRNQWSVYSLKILSLAIAFACGVLVIGFASGEFTVNSDQKSSDLIFRVLQRNNAIDYKRNRLTDRISPETYRLIRSVGNDTATFARVKVLDRITATTGTRAIAGTVIHAAEPSVTDVFDFDYVCEPIYDNNPKSRTVLLSASASTTLFGTTESAGNDVFVATSADTILCRVGAVFRDWNNMHEDFHIVFISDEGDLSALGYNYNDFGLYGKLMPGMERDSVEQLLSTRGQQTDISYRLQLLEEIYFGPRVSGENARHGDSYSIWILICLTILIIFLAITNYANLTTLTLPPRSTEIAIGKVAGAESIGLCIRLMQESFVMCTIALALGCSLVLLCAPLLESTLSLDILSWLKGLNGFALMLISMLLLVAFLAPLYPIIVFATASPRRLLSPEIISFTRLKRFITTVQLGTSISLIVAGLVIGRQIERSLIKEPGRNHDQVVYLKYPKELTRLYEIKQGWKRYNPNIVEVTAASQMPNNLQSKDASGTFHKIRVENDFFSFFDIDLKSGRGFKVNDQDSVMINEAGVHVHTGLKPIGSVQNFGSKFNQPEVPLQIMQSTDYRDYSFLFIRILEVNIRDTEAYLYRFFSEITSDPIRISYLDHGFEKTLAYEDTLNGLSRLLTLVGIVMACCAIYALSLSRVNDNLKQIAIRRTFGASRQQIVFLFAREFVYELLAACFIFGPLTFILLRGWLKNFVYAAHMHWADPLIGLVACVLIITCTNMSLIFSMSSNSTAHALRR